LLLILIAPHRAADYLVADHAALAFSAYERGCLTKLAAVLRDITPVAPRAEWEEDESESVAALREVRHPYLIPSYSSIFRLPCVSILIIEKPVYIQH
jgi:hypothetical protein